MGRKDSLGDDYEFLEKFRANNGRALRVLHIGNVANYAYVNAKLMRTIGIEADCIDPDFYHLMATPEWHEAIISGDWGDDFYPKWSACSIEGFSRPEWFIQGRVNLVFALLSAKNCKNEFLKTYFRTRLEFETKILAGDFIGFNKWLWTTKNPLIRLFRGPYRRMQFLCDKIFAPKYKFSPTEANELRHNSKLDFLSEYMKMPSQIRHALNYYDIVIGYTLSGGFAAATLFPNLIAYELGTLRGLPFEDSREGRLCKWVYTNAKEVFVTNVDCLEAAKKIGIEEVKINPMLHAYDIDIMLEKSSFDIGKLGIDKNMPFFLAPARHHWKTGNASWLKGNDAYLHALGKLHQKGVAFQLVTIDWGAEVPLSKAIIDEYGYGRNVIWLRPQSRQIMKSLYQNCTAVIDQFNAAAFGGVALDCFASAKPLVTKYDEAAGKEYFKTAPKLYNCADSAAILAALESILTRPNDAQNIGHQLREWLLLEHGVNRQLGDQIEVIARMLEEPNPRLPNSK